MKERLLQIQPRSAIVYSTSRLEESFRIGSCLFPESANTWWYSHLCVGFPWPLIMNIWKMLRRQCYDDTNWSRIHFNHARLTGKYRPLKTLCPVRKYINFPWFYFHHGSIRNHIMIGSASIRRYYKVQKEEPCSSLPPYQAHYHPDGVRFSYIIVPSWAYII